MLMDKGERGVDGYYASNGCDGLKLAQFKVGGPEIGMFVCDLDSLGMAGAGHGLRCACVTAAFRSGLCNTANSPIFNDTKIKKNTGSGSG